MTEANADDNLLLDPIDVFDWFTDRARIVLASVTLGTEFARFDKNRDGLLSAV